MRRLSHIFLLLAGGLILIKIILAFGADLLDKKSLVTIFPENKKGEESVVVGDKTLIIRLPMASTTVVAEYNQAGKFVSEWKGEGEEVVINGGYFHEDYSPSGFLVTENGRIGERIFDEDRSGLLAMKYGMFTIRDLKTQPLGKNEEFDFALQSYPFLIKDGQGAVREDSGLRARRTAVGMDNKGNIYIIVVSGREISLFEFMNELLVTKIPFTSVLNLDGGPSTGVYANWGEYQFALNSFTKVPSVLRFQKR